MPSVVKEWMGGLSFKQQTVILCSLRGCDGQSKEDISKVFVRYIRSIVLENGGTEVTPFMRSEFTIDSVRNYAKDMDKYPTHFIMHICFACEIIGFYHPNEKIRNWFNESYNIIVTSLHLKPETMQQCDERLKDGIDTP